MSASLKELARLYGVATEYDDATGKRVEASEESLLAVLSALGAPVETAKDAESAVRERSQAMWRRPVEPAVVAWNGVPPTIVVRLPDGSPQEWRSVLTGRALKGTEGPKASDLFADFPVGLWEPV